jgi:hypothetical protein
MKLEACLLHLRHVTDPYCIPSCPSYAMATLRYRFLYDLVCNIGHARRGPRVSVGWIQAKDGRALEACCRSNGCTSISSARRVQSPVAAVGQIREPKRAESTVPRTVRGTTKPVLGEAARGLSSNSLTPPQVQSPAQNLHAQWQNAKEMITGIRTLFERKTQRSDTRGTRYAEQAAVYPSAPENYTQRYCTIPLYSQLQSRFNSLGASLPALIMIPRPRCQK